MKPKNIKTFNHVFLTKRFNFTYNSKVLEVFQFRIRYITVNILLEAKYVDLPT